MRLKWKILCGLDAIWQQGVVNGLQQAGHEVTAVRDGRSLLDKLSEGEQFHIVVIDAERTSATLAQVQERLNGNTRIVAHTNDKEKLKTTRTEGVVYVSKSLTPNAFVAEALAQEMAE